MRSSLERVTVGAPLGGVMRAPGAPYGTPSLTGPNRSRRDRDAGGRICGRGENFERSTRRPDDVRRNSGNRQGCPSHPTFKRGGELTGRRPTVAHEHCPAVNPGGPSGDLMAPGGPSEGRMSRSVTVPREVEVTVAAVECDVRGHAGLGFSLDSLRDGSLVVTVEPCEDCLSAARKEGSDV